MRARLLGSALVSACIVAALVSGCSIRGEPKGGEILFVREEDKSAAIYLMSPDGGQVRRLVEGNLARWSPDGTRFAYLVDEDQHGKYVGTSVWVMNPDTGARRRLVNAQSAPRSVEVSGAYISAFAWAPDGVRLAYTTDSSLIFVLDTETGQSKLISIEPPLVDGLDWSPDGRKLLISYGVSVLDIGSGVERDVDRGTSGGRWSPDGERMAFAQLALPLKLPARQYIVVADRDGGNRERVTGGAYDSEPAWSPDGEQIYFSRAFKDQERAIFAVDLKTRSVRRLTENDVLDRLPDPRPSHRSLPAPPEPRKPRSGDIVVPNLIGRHVLFKDEQRRFRALGLKLKSVLPLPTYGILAEVREQVPRGGSRVPKGTVVKLETSDLQALYAGAVDGWPPDAGDFSPNVWKAHTGCKDATALEPGRSPRAPMYVDLIRRVLRRGMSRERVLSLLGDPERSVGRASDWPLWSLSETGCIYLRVKFNRQGRATRFHQWPSRR